jgi:hypothetical protein
MELVTNLGLWPFSLPMAVADRCFSDLEHKKHKTMRTQYLEVSCITVPQVVLFQVCTCLLNFVEPPPTAGRLVVEGLLGLIWVSFVVHVLVYLVHCCTKKRLGQTSIGLKLIGIIWYGGLGCSTAAQHLSTQGLRKLDSLVFEL